MSSPDAHLYATDAALYSHALDPGPDLYATDADLYADAGDRATAALRALERWLVARSFSRETDPRRDEDEAAEEETCAVCLGTVSTDSDEDRAVTTPCGHGYHLRCLLAALHARRDHGETTSECPTCRRTLAVPDHDHDHNTPPGAERVPHEPSSQQAAEVGSRAPERDVRRRRTLATTRALQDTRIVDAAFSPSDYG